MLRPTVPLLLAAFLLRPIIAPAQTPPPAKAAPQKVSIQVTFITVQIEDLDALGTNFNFIPLPASPRTFIALVEGNIAAQLYQTLTRTASLVGSYTIAPAPITVSDNVPAVFTVNTQIPVDTMPLPIDQGRSGFPQLTGSIQLHGKITLIPNIVPGNLVTLDMLSPVGSSQRMRLSTIPSGQQVAMNAKVFVKPLNSIGQGQIEGFSGHNKIVHTIELLIFITPTIVTQAVATAPAVKLQAGDHPMAQAPVSSSAASYSSEPYGFGGGFGPGFGLSRPSDVLRDTHWLGSLRWPGGNNIDGAIGRSNPVIEAQQSNAPKRIYAP